MFRILNPGRFGRFHSALWLWTGLLLGMTVPVKVHAQAGTVGLKYIRLETKD